MERDLLFYFNHADAAIGFKSSHSSFVSALYGVTAVLVNPDTYTDGLLKQVRKLRRIRDALYSLPTRSRRALEATYNYQCTFHYPSELVKIYDSKAGASLFNSHTSELKDLLALCKKKIRRKLTEHEEIIMFNIGEETRKLWIEMHEDYDKARKLYS